MCGAVFKGGPRAWYCPDCRQARKIMQKRESNARQAAGVSRKLGSVDLCENCGEPYTVASGKQKWCPACREDMNKKVDREQSLAYYYDNKDDINQRRNIKRRAPGKRCEICGRDFYSPTCTKYCSDECRADATRSRYRMIYDPRRRRKNKEDEDSPQGGQD